MAKTLTDNERIKAGDIRRFLKERAKDGKFFAVSFIKRTTGEDRHMICRTGVMKSLKGGKKSFDDQEKGLLTVFDMQKKGYRSIPCENVYDIQIHGEHFTEPTETGR